MVDHDEYLGNLRGTHGYGEGPEAASERAAELLSADAAGLSPGGQVTWPEGPTGETAVVVSGKIAAWRPAGNAGGVGGSSSGSPGRRSGGTAVAGKGLPVRLPVSPSTMAGCSTAALIGTAAAAVAVLAAALGVMTMGGGH